MTQNTAQSPRSADHGPGTSRSHERNATLAASGALFAGILLLAVGVMDMLQGIVAIAEDDVFNRFGSYTYAFSLTTWGWIHLILGIVVAATGWGILRGAEWARLLGIALATLNLVLQFMFLPYAPVWAIVSMAISVFVIWALASDRLPSRT